jgi:hypothetical protein
MTSATVTQLRPAKGKAPAKRKAVKLPTRSPAFVLPFKPLPRAAEAIAWGEEDRRWGRMVCLSVEKCMPPELEWRWDRRREWGNRVKTVTGWALVVVCALGGMALTVAQRAH